MLVILGILAIATTWAIITVIMEEIKVGEYVRTKQGYIHKDMIWWRDLAWIPEKDITKHSNNIIDLIKVGDYVRRNNKRKSNKKRKRNNWR